MISGREFGALLERRGFDFFTGVPCSLVEDVIAVLQQHPRVPYVAATREDTAVGVAAGAWFGGRRPAVLMQNSGLGTSLNALASLSLMYGLPALLVITWRGYQGKDAPEHILTGEISPALLDLLRIPYRVPTPASMDADVQWAVQAMDREQQPVALLLPPRVVETGAVHAPIEASTPTAASRAPAPPPAALRAPSMSRLTAIGHALKSVDGAPVVHANGYICRESYSVADRAESFYMIGSMGLAPAIALGVALARPERTTVVFDGDGNLLMNLGILAMIAAQRPANLVHVVFDNEVYGSTGNQASLSRQVRLDRLAAAAGFRTATAVTEPDALQAALRGALAGGGPHFVLVKVTADEADVPRIPYPPLVLRDRFRGSLRG